MELLSYHVIAIPNALFMKKITITLLAVIISALAVAQNKTVEMFGKILDKDMKPIANVIVTLKGTKFKTVTNGEGNYHFMLPAKKGSIVYSRQGYIKKETTFTGTPQATDLTLEEVKSKLAPIYL